MIDLLVAWLLFPLAAIAVLLGCGLLLRASTGVAIPAALLPGAGLAVAICAGHLTTAFDAAAELTTPVVVALAAVGYVAAWPREWRRAAARALPAAVAGGAAFLAFGAPVILSGDATFAGYVKLDDTATWLALTDRVMEHGRSLDGLAPSTYEATLAFNLGDGYPTGAFIPLGVGSQLVATDPAWLFQPYLSLLGGFLAVVLTELARPLVRSAALRAATGFVAAQPALLVGSALWGGIKEMEAAVLIALAAALAAPLLARAVSAAAVIPLAVATAALLAVLSLGGAIWLVPILLVPLFVLWRRGGPLAPPVVAFAALCALVLLPLVAGGQLLPPTSSPLTSADALGNLLEPLNPFQAFGIWPVGDFRLRPEEGVITAIAIALAAAAAGLAVLAATERRAHGPILYWAATLLGGAVLVAIGSPWVEGKALATASPAFALAAVAGIAVLFERGLKVEAALAALVVVGGILVSNVLGYRDVNLAPRDQLAELERIGERIEGEGPTLMTEYNPYGARHFLRDADPEGASELRRRVVPLRTGGSLDKGEWTDTDALDLGGLLEYRTLVLRRSPGQSRPPLPYRMVSASEYYEVWQRPVGVTGGPDEHLAIGDGATKPAAVAACAEIESLAARSGTGASLLFAERPPNVTLTVDRLSAPEAWSAPSPSTLLPREAGTASAVVEMPVGGTQTVWLGGSVRGEIVTIVDGERVGSVRHFINNFGLYIELARVELEAGEHTIELRYRGTDAGPGSGGRPFPIGPLVIASSEAQDAVVDQIPAERARELCGRHLDWVDVFPGSLSGAAP